MRNYNITVLAAQAKASTEKQARYQRVFASIAERRARGEKTVRVNITDLEAMLVVLAHTDAGVLA